MGYNAACVVTKSTRDESQIDSMLRTKPDALISERVMTSTASHVHHLVAAENSGLQLTAVDRLTVVAIAKIRVNLAVDRIADIAHRAVAKDHIESGGMGAAEYIGIAIAGCVLHRSVIQRATRVIARTADVVLRARIQTPIIATIKACCIAVGIEIFLTGQICIAGSVLDVGHCNRAVHKHNTAEC